MPDGPEHKQDEPFSSASSNSFLRLFSSSFHLCVQQAICESSAREKLTYSGRLFDLYHRYFTHYSATLTFGGVLAGPPLLEQRAAPNESQPCGSEIRRRSINNSGQTMHTARRKQRNNGENIRTRSFSCSTALMRF